MKMFLKATALMALLAGSVSAQEVAPTPQLDANLVELGASAPSLVQGDGVTALDAEAMSRITTLLSGYEYFPSADDLTGQAADPVPYLLAVVYDARTETLPIHRHRAIGALAYFPTDQTRSHLDHLLSSPATPELTRHHVINALANGFGDGAISEISPFLDHTDVQLRLTAVAALGAIGTSQSSQALLDELGTESHPLVRERIHDALSVE